VYRCSAMVNSWSMDSWCNVFIQAISVVPVGLVVTRLHPMRCQVWWRHE
jgi:hypothetical protein